MNKNNYGNRNYNQNTFQQRRDFQESEVVVISREIKNANFTLFKYLTKEDLYLPEVKLIKSLMDLNQLNLIKLEKFILW